ncbi:hypothetical protein GCM10009810_04490 [Nostocoides vanveenii]|uniref:Uncharacterized protein n=1 Tax=Nostocoides vanveenii TaxID=330835 RepID=A0ABN2K260_9MICO
MTFSSPDSVQASASRRAWAMACDDSGAGITSWDGTVTGFERLRPDNAPPVVERKPASLPEGVVPTLKLQGSRKSRTVAHAVMANDKPIISRPYGSGVPPHIEKTEKPAMASPRSIRAIPGTLR